MKEKLYFSERFALELFFVKSKLHVNTFNIIVFLNDKGFLNLEKIRNDSDFQDILKGLNEEKEESHERRLKTQA